MAVDERTDVVIVGAGGGGAVLGLALAQKGIRSLVLEQASGPPRGLRGEILQPNGQQVLDRLGLLHRLPADAVRTVRLFHFCRAGGERLCTIDYGMLPPPYNRALVTLPNVAHHAILDALEAQNPGGLRYGVKVSSLLMEGSRVAGVRAEWQGRTMTIGAKLVVGADGAYSKVREALGIPAKLHLYREAYLISILDSPEAIDEARYFVGRNRILGLFPAAGNNVYVFYMIPAGTYDRIKQQGLEALRQQWRRIDPTLEALTDRLKDWNQTAYMPTGRVRTPRWVADGAVLIGDAAHAMNPHASQGRMQAMADAMALAQVIESCLTQDRFLAEDLAAYERARRPQVEMLQRLADEQVLFWNAGNPVLAILRDRVFRTLDRNARLRYRMLATTAGWRTTPPFGLADRLRAAGLLPDSRAQEVPSEVGV
jgi:2-polyprenyl-6-methoxyphenol hydroxylase-like FAD-dependent oxidoreductase